MVRGSKVFYIIFSGMNVPKRLIKNILFIILTMLVLVVASSCLLNVLTHHGKELVSPDFTGMTIEEAESLAKSSSVRIEVIDTTYVKSVRRGCVFMQDPAAGSMVKKGRKIRLVVNAVVPRSVMMPNVEECPVRQAVSDLMAKGFIVGRLYYVPGFDDRVQEQMFRGKRIAPGSKIESGSVIDLKVGFDLEHKYTTIPDVNGRRSVQAQKEIKERSLNVSRVIYDSSVRTYADSINAVVYRQNPESSAGQRVKGSDMSIWLSVDPAKISR